MASDSTGVRPRPPSRTARTSPSSSLAPSFLLSLTLTGSPVQSCRVDRRSAQLRVISNLATSTNSTAESRLWLVVLLKYSALTGFKPKYIVDKSDGLMISSYLKVPQDDGELAGALLPHVLGDAHGQREPAV